MNIAHFNLAHAATDTEIYEHKTAASHLTEFTQACHKALLTCPSVIQHLAVKREIDLQTICEHTICYFDVALPLFSETYHNAHEIAYQSFEELRGCITVPIDHDGETVGIQGELFNAKSDNAPNNHLLSPSLVTEPFHFSKSVLRCVSQLDVLALQKHGYQNSFCDLSGSVSELTLDRLHRLGAEVLVYFTDAYGADFDVSRAQELSNYYCIRLCEVKLPFALSNFGLWDIYQWQLFDKRLSAALHASGTYNERYQA
ncbi:MAG: hypothetical protein MK214_15730 [Thalassotalea sp.]|nr:hypothetical protein [Thalassotalea sp.]